jgi:hypothetical protein
MATRSVTLGLVLAFALVGSQLVFADKGHSSSGAMPQIAKIMMHLNHYPSAAEKKILQHIIDDTTTSANQRIIASAILHVEHVATAADKKMLKNIMDDASAPSNERELARIIYELSHTPTAADKATLKAMLEK